MNFKDSVSVDEFGNLLGMKTLAESGKGTVCVVYDVYLSPESAMNDTIIFLISL